jgi:hypothetical protein
MRLLETVISIGFITIFHINLATDFLDGKTDPIGPYPRIPDREKLKVILRTVDTAQFFQARNGP